LGEVRLGAAESDDPKTTSDARHLAEAGSNDQSTAPAGPAEHWPGVRLPEQQRRALPDERPGGLRRPTDVRLQEPLAQPALQGQPMPQRPDARLGRDGCW
jgi:hypothetical protein